MAKRKSETGKNRTKQMRKSEMGKNRTKKMRVVIVFEGERERQRLRCGRAAQRRLQRRRREEEEDEGRARGETRAEAGTRRKRKERAGREEAQDARLSIAAVHDEVAQARASQDQVVVRAAEDKLSKFKDKLKQRVKIAPNYATLPKKHNMLRDASKLTSIQDLESEMKKLEEQVLKATDTPYEASVSNLDKLIKKLQRETSKLQSLGGAKGELDAEREEAGREAQGGKPSEVCEVNSGVNRVGRIDPHFAGIEELSEAKGVFDPATAAINLYY
ncbi:hypothetical protein Droror1_Dr00024008 [Drosera rotundifolia]